MRVILSGYYGAGNGGDEALLASLLQMLPPQVAPIVLSRAPAHTRKQYQVEAVDSRSPAQVLEAFREAAGFIWGGGSLIQDVTSALSPLYYCTLMALAQSRGLKTLAWAQGVGPLQRPFTRWLARQTFRGCSGISVRDAQSARLLQTWGLDPVVGADPVWALAPQPFRGELPPAPRLALALRPHVGLTPERLRHLVIALGQFQQHTRVSVVLVPFQPSRDEPLARQIQTALPGPSQVVTCPDPRELKGLFREMTMVIAMRFHALVMAAAAGCRCFALSYDPKVSQLMAQLALPGWDLNQIPDPDALTPHWLDCYHQGRVLTPQAIQVQTAEALNHQQLLQVLLPSA